MFSSLVAYYMFLGGAGAGLFVTCSVLSFFIPEARVRSSAGGVAPSRQYRSLFGGGYVASLGFTVLGCLCLWVDLGQPLRVINLFLHPTPSYISVGTFALCGQALLAGALALCWGGCARRFKMVFVRALQVAGVLVSVLVMVYPGLLLYDVKAVALWSSTFLMPVLFTVSSLVSGMAAFNAVACLTGTARPFSMVAVRLVAVDSICMVVEAALVAWLLVSAYVSGDPGRDSVQAMLTGDLAGMFWFCMVLVGLVIPPTIEVVTAPRFSTGVMLTTSLMVLAGGFALRVCIIGAGTNPLVMLGVG